MKDIIKWMRYHPLKSAAFAALFGFIPPFLAAMPSSWAWPGAVIFLLSAIAWATICYCDLKTITAAILVGAFLVPPTKAEEPPQEGPVAIGAAVVVVCVGGYCAYKLVKFCQKKFPKDKPANTNAPPDGLVAATGAGSYGASWNYGDLGSCPPWDGELVSSSEPLSEPITFVLDLYLAPGPSLSQSVTIHKGADTYQSWAEFRQEVSQQGLVLTGSGDGSQWFSRDGQPCDPSEVPIEFDSTTMTVRHLAGGPGHTVVIQRSEDLVNWSPLLRATIGEGTGFQVVDTSTKPVVFFKVQLAD